MLLDESLSPVNHGLEFFHDLLEAGREFLVTLDHLLDFFLQKRVIVNGIDLHKSRTDVLFSQGL